MVVENIALTFDDIKKMYPDEWVLIGNPDLEDSKILKSVVSKLRGGVLLYHSKTKMDVAIHAKEVKEGYDTFVCVYTGEISHNKRYWLSNW